MPYKSKAQQRLFHVKQKQGLIPASTVKEFDRASKGRSLPEHVKSKVTGHVGGKKSAYLAALKAK